RDIIPSYDKESLLWEGLCNELERRQMNIQYAENGMSMAVFYDKGYQEKDVDVEIRVEVKGKYEDTDHIKFRKIEPVKVASITFTGGYEKITEISYCIAKWITEHNYEMNGPNFSIYHVGYGKTDNPEEFVTEICYPIK
ncbi:MAG: GyrI-like domain-containing protein, partial [Firmicutes bacterium]|nr:GyrI-like domain-containing protein [Bacillota bacterium]